MFNMDIGSLKNEAHAQSGPLNKSKSVNMHIYIYLYYNLFTGTIKLF